MKKKSKINNVYKTELDNAFIFLIFADKVTKAEFKKIPEAHQQNVKVAVLNKKAGGGFCKDVDDSGRYCFYVFIRPNKNGELCIPSLNHELLHFAKWLSRLKGNKSMDEGLLKMGYPADKIEEEKECSLLGTVSSYYYQIIQCEKIPTTFQPNEEGPL